MATRNWKLTGLVVISLMCLRENASAQSLERFSFAEPHLGTIVEITIYAPEETAANEAARSAFLRVKELDRIFSDYKSDSEAMRLCDSAGSGRPIKVSRELFQVLKQSVEISERSNGALDVTIGPLVKLWRRARKQKILPMPDEITAAQQLVGWRWIKLDEIQQTVELQRSGMQLDFGAIAKGFIAQDVSRGLRERGLGRTLVAISGDIVAGDPPPDAKGWRIGIAPLERSNGTSNRFLLIKNRAISTSGDAFQFVEIDGVRYSHIVDPKTGLGLTHRSSVTVLADDGSTADALDTAICVMGPERGLKLIEDLAQERHEPLDVLIVQATSNGVRTHASTSFWEHEDK